ncbi:glycoside hydrolase domain-containing protein, partial [Clostridium sp.]|uniref:glycoside hydrolase domain-containing protein n=1 Tax=Clostridium sp. TaxID=1506 RepID=UPI003F3633D1
MTKGKNNKFFKTLTRMLSVIFIFTLISPNSFAPKADGSVEVVEKIINDFETGDGINKFSYSSGWSTSTNLPNLFYNGDEHWVVIGKDAANAANYYYNVKFEGSKIELYGDKGPMLGNYAVSIDGGEEVIIDAYNSTKLHQEKLFESEELENGIHTVKVRGTGVGTGNSADMQVDFAKVYKSKSMANGVHLSMNEVELEIGSIQNLIATVTPEEAINKEVVWTSEDESIVTVNGGLLEARGIGEAKVIATVKDTSITAECNVKVTAPSTEKMYTTMINDSSIGSGINQFRYTGAWGTGSGAGFYGGDEHWSSIRKGDTNAKNNYFEVKFTGNKIELYGTTGPKHGIYAVSIDGGEEVEVDAYSGSRIDQQKIFESGKLAYGTHTLKLRGTGKATGSEASIQIDAAKVYHKEIKAESIEMKNKGVSLERGLETKLEVIFNPNNTSIKDLEWSSSDESVATVSDNGAVLANEVGEATITAKLINTDLTATCKITVTEGNEYLTGYIGTTERHNFQEKYGDYVGIYNNSEDLVAWKGDKAISKLVLLSKKNGANNITVKASNFTNEKGNVIDGSNVTATFLKDVSATLGGVQPGEGFGQVIPNQPRQDVAEILYTTEPVSVEGNKLQQVWVDFNIPRDAESGVYTGSLEITADGLEEGLVFDYQIEVLNLTQPSYEESKFHLDLWQYPYSSARYYEVEPFSEEHFEILKPHMELYKNSGGKTITTTIVEDAWNNQTYDKYTSMVKWTKKTDGTFAFDFTDFDKWVAFNLELGINKQISAFSIVPLENRLIYLDEATGKMVEEKHYPGTDGWTNMWDQFLTTFVSHLDQKGWFDMVYIAMDERPVNQMIPALNLIESKPNKDGHTLKVSGAMNYSTMDRNLLNRIHDISIHAAHTNHTNGEVKRLAEERRELGLTTTLYTCTGSYPSNFTRSEPSDNIWTIWYSAYHNTDGYLRWALDSWTENPLEDSSHWYFEAGDTFLVYPGDKGTDNIQPRSSVRLEKMAEAIRDVEKVNYLKENAPELAAEIEALLGSINRYGGYGNGYGMAEGSEATKQAIADEAVRVKNEVARLSKKYVDLINVPVESVTLDKTEVSLEEGNTEALVATVMPETATNKNVTWTSSNEEVALVNEAGVVTGVKAGTAVITVTTEDGAKVAECSVTVVKPSGEIVVNKPINLKAKEVTENLVSLSWERPTTTEGLVGYVIYKDGKIIDEVTTEEYSVDGLKSNTIYG